MHMIQRLILPVIISFLCIMAWRSSGKSNAELVANLKSIYFLLISGHNIIKSIPVEQAMLKVVSLSDIRLTGVNTCLGIRMMTVHSQ